MPASVSQRVRAAARDLAAPGRPRRRVAPCARGLGREGASSSSIGSSWSWSASRTRAAGRERQVGASSTQVTGQPGPVGGVELGAHGALAGRSRWRRCTPAGAGTATPWSSQKRADPGQRLGVGVDVLPQDRVASAGARSVSSCVPWSRLTLAVLRPVVPAPTCRASSTATDRPARASSRRGGEAGDAGADHHDVPVAGDDARSGDRGLRVPVLPQGGEGHVSPSPVATCRPRRPQPDRSAASYRPPRPCFAPCRCCGGRAAAAGCRARPAYRTASSRPRSSSASSSAPNSSARLVSHSQSRNTITPAERAVRLVVGGEVGDVEAEGRRDQGPDHDREERADADPAEARLPDVGRGVVEQRDDQHDHQEAAPATSRSATRQRQGVAEADRVADRLGDRAGDDQGQEHGRREDDERQREQEHHRAQLPDRPALVDLVDPVHRPAERADVPARGPQRAGETEDEGQAGGLRRGQLLERRPGRSRPSSRRRGPSTIVEHVVDRRRSPCPTRPSSEVSARRPGTAASTA